tara:strand:+ start:95 stop:271 length:177 start_codon:yes stop_codon:yes gene_type:complete
MHFITDTITTITYIVTIASIIAAFTPSTKDDVWIDKLFGYIDLLALNFKIKIYHKENK